MRCDAMRSGVGVLWLGRRVTSRERKKSDVRSGQGSVRCRAGGGACGREADAEPAQGRTQPTDGNGNGGGYVIWHSAGIARVGRK